MKTITDMTGLVIFKYWTVLHQFFFQKLLVYHRQVEDRISQEDVNENAPPLPPRSAIVFTPIASVPTNRGKK